jgi:hypothetical protein
LAFVFFIFLLLDFLHFGKHFGNSQEESEQTDLSPEVALHLFTPEGLVPGRTAKLHHGRFALNEIPYSYAGGKAGEEIGKALSLATYNYMLGRGLDMPAKVWFKT